MDKRESLITESRKIAFKTQTGIKIITYDDIVYCRGDGRYTILYLNNNETLLLSRLLKSIEDTLPEGNFYRIHKSVIVNIDYVKEFRHPDNKYIILDNNTRLQIAKRRKSKFIKRLLT